MKQFLLSVLLSFSLSTINAQIQVLKAVGNNGKDYRLGFGAFLKFSFPVSEADYAAIEGGANFFQEKEDPEFGMAVIPVKLGYRYTLNRSGTGLYLEPQAGYNFYGVKSVYNGFNYDDFKFKGIVGAMHIGFLFEPGNKIQFDLGSYYERIFHPGGSTSYIGLRLSNNFSFGRRDE